MEQTFLSLVLSAYSSSTSFALEGDPILLSTPITHSSTQITAMMFRLFFSTHYREQNVCTLLNMLIGAAHCAAAEQMACSDIGSRWLRCGLTEAQLLAGHSLALWLKCTLTHKQAERPGSKTGWVTLRSGILTPRATARAPVSGEHPACTTGQKPILPAAQIPYCLQGNGPGSRAMNLDGYENDHHSSFTHGVKCIVAAFNG